jgi:transcriptional regulator with XRE-family HTH domain
MGETIYGDRMRQARTLRQRKLADVAVLLECSVPTLSKWEHAQAVDVSPRRLSLLAATLKFSPSFFAASPSPPLADNDLLFKAPKVTSRREAGWLREFVRLACELLDWLDERRHLPPVKIRPVSRGHSGLPEVARELRAALGLPATGPVEHLTHAAERAGVAVVVRRPSLADGRPWASPASEPGPDSSERHDGCSAWAGQFRERPLIVMRAVPGWEKTRWILGHELGHLMLHGDRMPVTDEAEEQASRFASELLAPVGQITAELPRVVTLAALLEVKFKWGISLAALIRHLHSNGVITDQRKTTLYRQLYTRQNPDTGRSYGATEPGWDASAPERPQLVSAWLRHVTGTLVPGAIAQATGIFPADLLASILQEQRPLTGAALEPAARPGRAGEVIRLSDRAASRAPGTRQQRMPLTTGRMRHRMTTAPHQALPDRRAAVWTTQRGPGSCCSCVLLACAADPRGPEQRREDQAPDQLPLRRVIAIAAGPLPPGVT